MTEVENLAEAEGAGSRGMSVLEEIVERLGVAVRRLDERSAGLDQRAIDIETERARVLCEANSAASEIIAAAHRSASRIVDEARQLGEVEQKRFVGDLIERERRIAELDGQITERATTLHSINRSIAELHASVAVA
jgi:hypothetical protein